MGINFSGLTNFLGGLKVSTPPKEHKVDEQKLESQKTALTGIFRSIHKYVDGKYTDNSLKTAASFIPFAGGYLSSRIPDGKADGRISANNVNELSKEPDLKKIAEEINRPPAK